MEMEVKERKEYPEGVHTGTIIKIDYRETPYKYTDVIVQPDDFEISLKYGCPTVMSEGCKLHKLISLFEPVKVGDTIDVEKILLNKKVRFLTTNEETPKGTFARIAVGSLKPVAQKVSKNEREGV